MIHITLSENCEIILTITPNDLDFVNYSNKVP